ncbi:hypothetical protein DFH29DRAFT_505294 [Suillus ampliporus]|nr:hypothetical protein DFH29DRAFT_505294 [Suillus ampliporus]
MIARYFWVFEVSACSACGLMGLSDPLLSNSIIGLVELQASTPDASNADVTRTDTLRHIFSVSSMTIFMMYVLVMTQMLTETSWDLLQCQYVPRRLHIPLRIDIFENTIVLCQLLCTQCSPPRTTANNTICFVFLFECNKCPEVVAVSECRKRTLV